jgi:tripartite-type tricarboxylate transporter receptor subunit TctC
LSKAIATVVQRPEVQKLFVSRNVEPWGSTPQALGQTIEGELAQWGPIIRKSNITL